MGRTDMWGEDVQGASTRQQILTRIRDAADPPSAHELAASLAVHVTTVRFHLEQLERTGVVIREVARTHRRGRPTVRYRAGAMDVSDVREQMIATLARAMAGSGRDRAATAGRRWAEQLAPSGDDPTARITSGLTQLGFDPEPVGSEIRLHACPFREAARENPDVVCRVHLGLAQGLADSSSHPVRVGLVPFVEPELCIVTVEQGET